MNKQQYKEYKLERKRVLNKLYIDFINTGKDSYYNELYANLESILISMFGANTAFKDVSFQSTFEDTFQNTMIKLYTKKDSFNIKKGNVITFAATIFNNNIIDEKRKMKVTLVDIDTVDFSTLQDKGEFSVDY